MYKWISMIFRLYKYFWMHIYANCDAQQKTSSTTNQRFSNRIYSDLHSIVSLFILKMTANFQVFFSQQLEGFRFDFCIRQHFKKAKAVFKKYHLMEIKMYTWKFICICVKNFVLPPNSIRVDLSDIKPNPNHLVYVLRSWHHFKVTEHIK